MINFYESIAQKLFGVRYLFWFLILCCAGGFIYSIGISTSEAEDVNILLSAVGASWFLSLSVVISYFYKVTGEPAESDGFFLKLKKRIKRFFSWCMAFFISGATIALVYLSYKAMGFYLSV